MQNHASPKQLRSFGLTVGGIFAGIGFWPLVVHGSSIRLWAVIIGGLLLLPAIMYPRSLSLIYKGWMALGEILGWVNTRIILGVVFYLVVTPIGIVRRLMGNDPMGRLTRPDQKSYRVPRQPRPASHMTKQF